MLLCPANTVNIKYTQNPTPDIDTKTFGFCVGCFQREIIQLGLIWVALESANDLCLVFTDNSSCCVSLGGWSILWEEFSEHQNSPQPTFMPPIPSLFSRVTLKILSRRLGHPYNFNPLILFYNWIVSGRAPSPVRPPFISPLVRWGFGGTLGHVIVSYGPSEGFFNQDGGREAH